MTFGTGRQGGISRVNAPGHSRHANRSADGASTVLDTPCRRPGRRPTIHDMRILSGRRDVGTYAVEVGSEQTLGIIAGSGFEAFFDFGSPVRARTSVGRWDYFHSRLAGLDLVVVPRHGLDHSLPPHRIPSTGCSTTHQHAEQSCRSDQEQQLRRGIGRGITPDALSTPDGVDTHLARDRRWITRRPSKP